MVALKDIFHVKGEPTSCGSGYPSIVPKEDAQIVSILKQAEVPFKKCTLSPFSCGSLHPTLKDPNGRSYGASSTGCAKEVIDNNAIVAVGSDTGGSIRWPAARVNLYGFKPTYGLISRYGMVPLCQLLDTVGIIAKDLVTVKRFFTLLTSRNQKDPTKWTEKTVPTKVIIDSTLPFTIQTKIRAQLEKDFVCKEQEIDSKIRGLNLKETYIKVMCKSFFSNMTTYNGVHHYNPDNMLWNCFKNYDWNKNLEKFQAIVRARIQRGEKLIKEQGYDTPSYAETVEILDYELAQSVAIVPVSTTLLSEDEPTLDEDYLLIGNFTKRPSLVIPSRVTVGLQIIGPKGSDDTVLKIAEKLRCCQD